MKDIEFLLRKTSPLNLYRVLRAIWASPGLSRSVLSANLRLDKSTITKITADLLQREIIEESAEGDASQKGGRRPVFLRVRGDFGCVVGLEIQTERYTAVAVDMEGKVLYSRSEPMAADGKPLPSVFLDIMSEVSLDLEGRGLDPLGIGVGVSGIVDSANGVIQQSIPLGISSPGGVLLFPGQDPGQAPLDRQRRQLLLLGGAGPKPRGPAPRVPLSPRRVPQGARRRPERRRSIGGYGACHRRAGPPRRQLLRGRVSKRFSDNGNEEPVLPSR